MKPELIFFPSFHVDANSSAYIVVAFYFCCNNTRKKKSSPMVLFMFWRCEILVFIAVDEQTLI